MTVKSAEEIPDNWADVIISNHVLEHTLRPFDELRGLYPKVRKGGKIIFVLPHEKNMLYRPGDINQHLYTWSPMNAGNLFKAAGFNIEKVETINHRWPPKYLLLYKILGAKGFYLLCLLYAFIKRDLSQVRVVANKC